MDESMSAYPFGRYYSNINSICKVSEPCSEGS